jgi:hypothetical protein
VTSLPVTLIPKPYNCLYSLRQSRRLSGRVNRFEIQPNQAVQLECVPVKIRPTDRDRDPVYKVNVDLQFDDSSNIDSLYVAHTTMNGNVYSRSDQYNQTTLSQPIPLRTKWVWKGTWKKHPNFTMIGDVTRSSSGVWLYTETQYRNGQLNMQMESVPRGKSWTRRLRSIYRICGR